MLFGTSRVLLGFFPEVLGSTSLKMKSSFSVGIAHFCLTKGERKKKTFTFSFKQSLDLTMVCVCEKTQFC